LLEFLNESLKFVDGREARVWLALLSFTRAREEREEEGNTLGFIALFELELDRVLVC
jgi:hypothetical protein